MKDKTPKRVKKYIQQIETLNSIYRKEIIRCFEFMHATKQDPGSVETKLFEALYQVAAYIDLVDALTLDQMDTGVLVDEITALQEQIRVLRQYTGTQGYKR